MILGSKPFSSMRSANFVKFFFKTQNHQEVEIFQKLNLKIIFKNK
jgi:hypothetical protein